VAKTLDAAVAAFHRRPLKDVYKVLMLDEVVLSRKTGAGALKRPVLVALGIRPDGKKEVIDFRLAASESAAEWERFLTDLYGRGLRGESLDMICGDGGQGLLAALPIVFPEIPLQRCWAHKIRNVLNKVRKADHAAVKRALHRIMNAANAPAAARRRVALRRPLERRLPQRRRLPQERSRRTVDLLPLPVRSPAQGGQDHQRHRAPLPRSAAPHPTHGHLPGQDLHGPHPLRRVHPRKQITGRQHPFPADTKQLTLPQQHRFLSPSAG
jgi:transposase-like protein